MAYLMGIDLGTSSLKTLLMDEDGRVLTVCVRDYQFAATRQGWAEHDPQEWWDACVCTVRQVLSRSGVRGEDVAGVSFQSDSAILNPSLSTNTFCGYKLGRWITMGAIMNAGLCLKWCNKLLRQQNGKPLRDEVLQGHGHIDAGLHLYHRCDGGAADGELSGGSDGRDCHHGSGLCALAAHQSGL